MSISFIASVPVGNAVQLMLSPAAGAISWRVLRKRTDDIASQDDPAANVAYEGDDRVFIDRYALLNGTTYFYRAFYWDGAAWVASASRSVVVASTFGDLAVDVVDVVRERVDLGFQAYVERGFLVHDQGHIPVLLATPAFEEVVFPAVTVHVISDGASDRAVGEVMAPDISYPGAIGEESGWLSRYQLQVIAWCLNGDVRALLRKALKAIVQANFPVFESAGMSLVEAQFADADDMTSYQAPVYQAICTFTCVAPSVVEAQWAPVQSVEALLLNP